MKRITYFVIGLIPYLIVSLILLSTAVGFDEQINYAGIGITNTSDDTDYNGTYAVTTYLFYDSTCSGAADYTETDSAVNITDGNFVIILNYSLSNINQTFYVLSSIEEDNQTCFQYTMAAQSKKADNASDSDLLRGYSPSTLPISGSINGTLNDASVNAIVLNTITYSGLLGFGNLTVCSNNEILKVDGSAWNCENDDTGSNNYVSGVSVTGTSTKNITLTRSGLSDISTTWTDLEGGGGNSSEEIQAVYYPTLDTYANTSDVYSLLGTYANTTDLSDTDTNTTSIQVTGTTTKTLNLEQDGQNNLTAQWTDIDTTYNSDEIYIYESSNAFYWNTTYADTIYLTEDELNSFTELDTQIADATLLKSGGTLTSAKWCVYDGSGIDCNVEPVVDTDTNESTRMDNVVGTSCGSGDYIFNFSDDGTPQCGTPSGSGDITAVNTMDIYLYKDLL